MDRVTWMKYPGGNGGQLGEQVNFTYNPMGLVKSVAGTETYVGDTTYNALGQVSELTYGNNLQERRGYYGLGGHWDSRPGSGLAAYGRLWRIRVRTATGTPLFDLRYNYDSVGNVTRLHEAPRQTANWPTTYTFQDSFNSKNTSAWTWSSQQTVPYNDGGNNVVKSTGTGSNWNANFYRNSTLTTGQGLSVRFKVDSTTVNALWAIETADSAKRFAIYATGGKLIVQYNDGGGWRYPADLLTALQANTWYVARIVIDDVRGFYLEVYQENAPTVRGSYQQWLAQGLAWRFRHWIYSGTAYLDDYREFSAAGITWTPDERMNFGYDALHRLISAAADSGAQGYGQTYQYNAIGNLTYKSDVGSYTYPAAGQARPHAATAAGSNSYSYDANGNMVSRTEAGVTYTQTWDEENRLKTVTVNGQTTTYVYDGDGRRVKKVQNGQTTVYIGNYYEKNLSTGVVTKYYYAGGQRVAQRRGSTVYYFTADHLGSTSLVTDASGNEVARQKYYPFGAPRSTSGTLPTDYRFTGQRSEEAALGSLYDYGARFYSPVLGRFLQADTLVPEPGNPQSLNRYSYVRNNPLRLVDPSGMAECAAGDTACWVNEWNWKNRWYKAHGYGWDGNSNHWSAIIPAEFKDPDIFNKTMEEAGINIRWQWGNLNDVMGLNIARGVVRFGQALAGGLAQLKVLLGGGATIEAGALRGSPYAPPWQNNTVRILGSTNETWIQQTVVHELAHVIDWHNNFSQAWAKQNGALTDYAADLHPYPAIWEVWAEAVTVWVFGSKDQNTGVWSSSTIKIRSSQQNALTTQMDRLTVLLGGSR